MRVSFRYALWLVSLVFANSAFSNADPITVIVTTVGTGTFDSQPFTNSLVTFITSLTTETLDACESLFPNGGCLQDSSTLFLDSFDEPVTFTVGVASFGTFGTNVNYNLFVSPGTIAIGDVEDRLGLNVNNGPPGSYDLRHSIGPFSGPTVQDFLGDNCEFFVCPIYASTTGGDLILTSTADTATGEIEVGSPSPVPEPGTLILLGTGLVGAITVRYRKFSTP